MQALHDDFPFQFAKLHGRFIEVILLQERQNFTKTQQFEYKS